MAPAMFARLMRQIREAAKAMRDAAWEMTATGNNLTELQADRLDVVLDSEVQLALSLLNDAVYAADR